VSEAEWGSRKRTFTGLSSMKRNTNREYAGAGEKKAPTQNQQ